jgi:SET domain-containing protein
MPLLEKYLYVKRSTIPGAGKGLFTKKLIPKGKRIVEYKGTVTPWKDAAHKNGLNGYIYYVNRHHVIDASNNKNSLARYANDAKGAKKISTLSNNCKYEEHDTKVYIVSKKEIPPNAEILVGYGKQYWDVLINNIHLVGKERAKAKKKSAKRQVA